MERLFVYASLLSQCEVDKHCATARFESLAWLADRRVAFTKPARRWGGHSADVIAAPGERVWGVIYAVGEHDLDALDAREGVPDHYRRIAVEVITAGAGERTTTWMFEAADAMRRAEAAPSADYLAAIISGARERGLPADYISALEAAAARLPAALLGR
jgi:gamma-glutamylcyclotransferase (GGCT)/AIG2-like uncharacterized protein YtfP